MKPVLLIDFGSTYTKVTAVDVEGEKILGTSQSWTTINTDINDGLNNALANLEKEIGHIDFEERFACSSAAGGLKIVSVGLVPELTAEAAKMASLGAGGKVLHTFSFELTPADAAEIAQLKPEIVLLCGGTDGGNTDCILHNAQVLADIKGDFAVIIAGNRVAAAECEEIISKHHKTYTCENVLPKFDELNIEPTQKQIRDIFLARIISAKGITTAGELVQGIVNPTPAAVLRGIKLLADGTKEEEGIGQLLAVDVGGATTDVYTICSGKPTKGNVVLKGIPEPYAKRTVEGDIGMRYSIKGIVEAAGIDEIAERSGLRIPVVEDMVDDLSNNTEKVPTNEDEEALDFALASMAIDTAVERHAGHIEEVFTTLGQSLIQTGKDLTQVRKIVVTGGSLIHTKRTDAIAANGCATTKSPYSLRPLHADVLVDRKYIIASMGLLGEHYPDVALRIMKQELENMGDVQNANAPAPSGTDGAASQDAGGIAAGEEVDMEALMKGGGGCHAF